MKFSSDDEMMEFTFSVPTWLARLFSPRTFEDLERRAAFNGKASSTFNDGAIEISVTQVTADPSQK